MADQINLQGDQMKLQMRRLVPPVDIIMDDFEKHKKIDDEWYSPPFHTHLVGYRMCLRVYANGFGKHMCLCLFPDERRV